MTNLLGRSVVSGVCASLVAVVFATVALAGDPVRVSAVTTDSSPVTVSNSGSRVLSLTDSLTRTNGAFSGLAGRPYDATLSVGRANGILSVSSNASGTVLTVRDSSGNVRTFNGTTAEEARAQLHDFLETGLNGAFGAYQTVLNKETGLGVTDGSPLAATAFLANDAFGHFGAGFEPANSVDAGRFKIGFDASAGTYRTDGLNGDYYSIDLSASTRLSDRFALVFSIPLQYRELGGTDTYAGGLTVGLPITVLARPGAQGLAWHLTPWAHVGGGINEDLLSGGGMFGGGMTNSFIYRVGNWQFTFATQIGYDTGFSFTYGSFEYDTPVEQYILKNGLFARYEVSSNVFVDGGLAHTNFLRNAAVDGYFTPTIGLGLGWGKGKASSVSVRFSGDYGDGFSSGGVSLSSTFAF